MSSKSLYVKDMAGFFPGADSTEALWENLLAGKVAPTTNLSEYWKISKKDYLNQNFDTHISCDVGHLAMYTMQEKKYPRQINAAIEIGRKLAGTKTNFGLVIATEWTDPSYYEAELGLIPKDQGFSVDRQIETIKKEIGITGPALAVDAACASSLYAIDVARGMLMTRSLDGVIVIGLNLYLHSFLYRGFTKLGALSLKRALTSFAEDADGIIPGEAACGVLVDQTETGALAEISGIGLSCDGSEGSAFSPGLTGQLAAYERAYLEAGINPADIDFLEAHGTATVLGDETECRSISKFFNRRNGNELPIGSSKANLGHTLAASGLISLIKCVEIIRRKVIPPHIRIRPRKDLKEKGIRVIQSPEYLKKEIICVAISSFGFGGSNAHLVLRTPSPAKNIQPLSSSVHVCSYLYKTENELRGPTPILRDVAMGPKMQERYDRLQRHVLAGVQNLIKDVSESKRSKLTCLFLNNLGGELSLEFERKYRFKFSEPALSIEGIASTLPSMMSGASAKLFNFRGYHLLFSGAKGNLADLMVLLPYYLEQVEGEIILGAASNKYLGLLHLSSDSNNAIANIELIGKGSTATDEVDLAEATGMDRIIAVLSSEGEKDLTLGQHHFKVKVLKKENEISNVIAQELLQKSLENKEIALAYLDLIQSMQPEKCNSTTVGEFLRNCEMGQGEASGELIVDERHPYFCDHPLDHVPGILIIHGCEELLNWYKGSECLINYISIKFTKFLNKNESTTISLQERSDTEYDVFVSQGKKRAGIITIKATKKPAFPFNTDSTNLFLATTDKRYTHKHRDENVLVSKLEHNKVAMTLNLNKDKSSFFSDLLIKRPSALYLAEVTRQFVMMLAHEVRGISLASKMNLISTEISVSEWLTPSFELLLDSFELNETEDFLLAEVAVKFQYHGVNLGLGKVKAQVVSSEYYALQRGGK